MLTEKTRPSRYYSEGILSFVKSCHYFEFRSRLDRDAWKLIQYTDNPSVYTKLSCFLPWVAAQYGLLYDNDNDTACYQGQGDPLDKDKKNCTTNGWDVGSNPERSFKAPCIFPFYFDGKRYDECIVSEIYGFTQVVYRCPYRNSTSKFNGTTTNNFTSAAFTEGYCLDEESYYNWLNNDSSDISSWLSIPVNPDQNWCTKNIEDAAYQYDISVSGFGQCKNNCPGGKTYNKLYKI